ncbi:MAG TPA: DUF4926 domain-containing protein [Planctomycetota bacterium]|nr:DUF4926 domain-containing protein [Planctomycetota bacterium]
MAINLLDEVVLKRDLPESGLRACDLGTVVMLYAPGGAPDGAEVEFVTVAGTTRAVVTVAMQDIRPVTDRDLLAVRCLTPQE